MSVAQEPRTRSRTAFVTGATGFVGSFLIDRLLRDGWRVIALARGTDAPARVRTALQNVRGHSLGSDHAGARLRVIAADVRDPRLGLRAAEAEQLANEVDAIWHCAANFGTGGPGETPHSVNVTGTQNLLTFAGRCHGRRHVAFYYVSTAFAADSRDGLACEDPPRAGVSGRNAYECSKREAERLVLDWQKATAAAVVVLRPSIILGHSRTGRASGFAAYYDCLRSLRIVARAQRSESAATSLRVRSRADLRVNFVTIDFVIDAMCAVAQAPCGDDCIFHLVNEVPAVLGDVVTEMCRSLGLTGVVLADEAAFAKLPMTRHERLLHSMIGFELPYLAQEVLFDNSRFRRVVPAHLLPAPRIDALLLQRINRGYHDHCEREAVANRARRQPAQERASLHVAVV